VNRVIKTILKISLKFHAPWLKYNHANISVIVGLHEFCNGAIS
jgi:hypothetical protein